MAEPEETGSLAPASSLFVQCILPGMGQAEESPGDYRDENGILHCGVCKKPKEMALSLFGDDVPPSTVRILCDCQQKALDEEDARAAAQRRRIQNEEALETLLEIGAALPFTYDFSQYDGGSDKNCQQARYYAEHFDRMLRENVGLMLYGDTGRGKTFFSESIGQELLKQGYMVFYTRIGKIADACSANNGRDRTFVMNAVSRADLLILDDLGAERDTPYMMEQADTIINTRYISKKPLITTTNLHPRDLVSAEDLAHKRPYERIMEMCRPVEIIGENRRAQIAAKRSAAWEKILGGTEE